MSRTPPRALPWLVLFSIFLRIEPEAEQDIVTRSHVYGFGEEDDGYMGLYATEEEAWTAAREFLEETRDQALRDIAFLTRPYWPTPGKVLVNDPANLNKWIAEAREELRMAEKGLSFCPQS